MAVVTVKSTQITARDASPRTLSNSITARAAVQHARGVCTLTSGNDIASKYIFFSIPSNALVLSVRENSPDIGTTTAGDVGLYRTTADGGAVVDADFFKAATVLNAGALSKSEVVAGNVITVANGEKRIWEHLAAATDPKVMYDVVLTLTGAADATAQVLLEIDFVQ